MSGSENTDMKMNGTAWKWIAGMLGVALVSVVSTGLTLGVATIPVMKRDISTHINSSTIHEGDEAKKRRIHETVGPMIELIQKDLDHIIATQQEQGEKLDRLIEERH